MSINVARSRAFVILLLKKMSINVVNKSIVKFWYSPQTISPHVALPSMGMLKSSTLWLATMF